ncbi:MAG: 3-phosphoshikimate 1-carboxyvinyltransferase [Chloroflexi bacterium]|nr:3-phosphoshikimate 1-carboxyvinyltransferase [Chloroflexota bacterium]
MQAIPIAPIPHPLRASVRVPGSKSLTNRALAIAALADGTTTLTNALDSDDSRYFAESLQQLGFDVSFRIPHSALRIRGLGGRIPSSRADLFVGNAGTAARFLTAFVALGHGEFVIDGNERMRQRPIADLIEALKQLGVDIESPTGYPPVIVRADGLKGGVTRVAGNISSQFLSALLIAAPYAQQPVEIIVTGELNSKPYVDMTVAVMSDFGATVEREGYERFRITPQRYRARQTYTIESDASAASYFFAAPAVCGGAVCVENISRKSKQGDVAFVNVLAQMGCAVNEGEDWIEVVRAIRESPLHGVEVDLRDIPDTAQTLAAIAPFADSPTTIRGIASARVKETDRVAATCAELRRLGVAVEEYPDGLKIYPCDHIRPAVIQTYDDHRMAMAFALVGLRAEGIAIEDPGCVSKTFPNYFQVLASLRE